MRPRRLELEGFSAYRNPVEVDFEGVDLFALTGPTGVGKTAILDAIAFALYGVVHRLGDKKAVAPAISQGRHEARVRLDFTVGDQAWTAVRSVRRTKGGGATTAEARLEGPDGVVAGTADEVTTEVTRLLGLTYDHFTRCVVLPQGEFARFLHDKPSDRQDLLVSLLELGVYGRMAQRAGQRAGEARRELDTLDGNLAQLAAATDDAVDAAAARAGVLADLLGEVDAALPAVTALEADEARHRAVVDEATRDAGLLEAVVVPGEVAGLAAAESSTAAALAQGRAAVEAAEAALVESEQAAAGLPERAELVALLAAFDEEAALAARREKGDGVVAELRDHHEAAAHAQRVAEADESAARLVQHQVQAAHRAHAVRADLVAGEPCPVCEHVVTELPGGEAPPDLDDTRAAVAAAEIAEKAASAAATDAARQLSAAEAKLAEVDEQLAARRATLADRERPSVEAELAAVDTAAATVRAAAEAATSARETERAAVRKSEAAAAAVAGARRHFDEVRDGVARLDPPARVGADLATEWDALAAWAVEAAPASRARATEATDAAEQAATARSAAVAQLHQRCAEAGVAVPKRGSLRDAVVEARAQAGSRHESLVAQRAEAEKVEAARADAQERHDLARSLATHLDAKHFEQWLLGEAVRTLAAGATELLHSLSGGHYSLSVDGRGNFVVVDHHNADEVRSARTLSGGETFLASLALALALADRIAAMASGGAARLDAIFLDEGFGTLDPDTLDVVASAVEELGAAGRMVGVVSHVAELAERVPVSFEVSRSGNTSLVTRVER